MLAAARAPRLGRRAVVRLARCVGRSVGSAGLRALVVLSDASCVGRESLHACCEFAGIDALLVQKKKLSIPALAKGFVVNTLQHLLLHAVRTQ